MKKIISLLLMLVMLISSTMVLIPAYGAEAVKGVAEAELLYKLGITDFLVPDNIPVTRAEFIRYVMRLANIPLSPFSGNDFDDVDETNNDYKYIMSAVDFGLISKSVRFRPNDAIRIKEASKIIVNLLGYDYIAEANGGYPGGYMYTSQTLKLFENAFIGGETITRSEMCIILFNALHTELPEVTYGADGAYQYTKGNATILNKYHNMYVVSGIVDGTEYYSCEAFKGLGKDHISVDGRIFRSENIDTDSIFAYEIDAYVDLKTNIVKAYYVIGQSKSLNIYAEDIISYSDYKFKYYDENNNVKTVKIAYDTNIFYNGKGFEYDEEKLIPESGSLTFVSGYDSSEYSTLIIKSYKTIVVDRVIPSEYLIADKYSSDNNIILDSDKMDISITDESGKNIKFSSITSGMVLCAAISEDGEVGEVVCVNDEFSGKYDGKGDSYILVNGTPYRLTEELSKKFDGIISMGKNAVFKLDKDHRIADVTPISGASGEQIGYVFYGKYVKKGVEDKLILRILNSNGEKNDYRFADIFTIDNKSYKDSHVAYNDYKTIYGAEETGSGPVGGVEAFKCGMVIFKLDDNGDIVKMNYATEDGTDSGLYETYSIAEANEYQKFDQWYYTIGTVIYTNTAAVVFKVPAPDVAFKKPIDVDDYEVVTPLRFANTGSPLGYRITGYSTTVNEGFSNYLLYENLQDSTSTESANYGNGVYLVSQLSQVLVDGEEKEAIELYEYSGAHTFYAKTENYFNKLGVKPGDLVRINTEADNIIKSMEIIYERGSDTFKDGTSTLTTGGIVPDMSGGIAYAYKLRGKVLETVYSGNDMSDETTAKQYMKSLYVPETRIYKYDERAGRVVEREVNFIKDYHTFGNDCTKLFFRYLTTAIREIYILD